MRPPPAIVKLEAAPRGGAITQVSGYLGDAGGENGLYPERSDVGITQEGKCVSIVLDGSYDVATGPALRDRKITLTGKLYGASELMRPDGLAPRVKNYCGADVVMIVTAAAF